jgi:pentose-5-phosphate-3-epimerase
MLITPAILPENYEQLVHKLFVLEGLIPRVQIDLCDGVFGLEKTWLPYREKELPEGFMYEFDLMVTDWRKYLTRAINLGASRVVMHIDDMTDDDLSEIVDMVKPHRIALGLCVSNDKNVPMFAMRVRRVEELYSRVFIQVMGIENIGAQGQPFDESVLRRISYLHSECPGIDIQVDGSMNPETILKVKKVGARCAVVGSYLFSYGATHKLVKKNLDKLIYSFK